MKTTPRLPNFRVTHTFWYSIALTAILFLSRSGPAFAQANPCAGDNIPPVISGCPTNITVFTGAGATTCSKLVTWTPPTATDNCSSTVTVTSNYSTGDVFQKGVTTVTYTFKDGNNNTSTCSFTVSVIDNTPPVLSTVTNIVVNNTPGVCGAIVTYTPPTFTDNCPSCVPAMPTELDYAYLGTLHGHSYYESPSTGDWDNFSNFALSTGGYLTTISSREEDSFLSSRVNGSAWIGLTDHASEGTFVWTNGEPFVYSHWCSGQPNDDFGGQDYGIINAGTGGCWDDVNSCCLQGIIEYNCSFYSERTAGPASGSLFPLGTTTITYIATDASGNIGTTSFTVTVNGGTTPVITCPPNATVSCDGNTNPSNTGTATSTTPCSGITPVITYTDASTQVAGLAACGHYNYTITRTWKATSGTLSSTCNQIITVQDVTAPTAICKSVTVNLTANGTASITPADVNNGSNDNCSPVTLYSVTPSTFTCANIGQNVPVTLTVKDACGNTSTCTTTVTVKDNTPPVITCPANATISCSSTTGTGTATATDNCGTPTITSSDVSTQVAGLNVCGHYNYTITRTWKATDASLNFSTCVQTITVIDNTPPVAICKNKTVTLVNGTASITPADIDNGSNDNCSPVTLVSVTPSTFTCANAGQNVQVTLTVKDVCGNTSTCTSYVTVVGTPTPVITCPANVTVSCSNNCLPASTGVATAINNCGCGTMNITYSDVSTRSTNPAVCAYYSYTISRTWTATVGSNSTSCVQTITVVDNTPPVAICKNKTVTLVNGTASITPADVNNGSNDNCSPVTLVSVTPSTFTCANAGQNVQVTLTVKDVCGNTSTCTSYVTVVGTPTPVITCPPNVTVSCSNSCLPASTGVATATNNCGCGTVVITSSDVSTRSTNPAVCGYYSYTITRTWTATVGSNSTSCVQTITVVDNTPPVAICKSKTVTLVNGTASITPADINNGSYDNCSPVTLVSVSPSTFTCANAGQNVLVTLTVKDVCGNTSTCTSYVTVTGATCNCSIAVTPSNNTYTGGVPTNIYLGYGPQSATLTANSTASGTLTYLWSGLSTSKLSCTTCKNPVFTPAAAGNYTFTVTIRNGSGCSSTCSVTLCVKDIRVGNNSHDSDDDDDDNSSYNNHHGDDDDDYNCNYSHTQYVYMCHVANNCSSSSAQTYTVRVSSVASHLSNHSGDRLGRCTQTCGSNARLVADEVKRSEVKVYPNPNNGSFTLELPYFKGDAQIIVTDIQGKLITRKTANENDGTKVKMDLGQVAHGMYLVEVKYGKQHRFITRFVVE